MIEALVPDLYVDADYYSALAAEMGLLDELEPTYGVVELELDVVEASSPAFAGSALNLSPLARTV